MCLCLCVCVRVCGWSLCVSASFSGSRWKPGQNIEWGRLPLISADTSVSESEKTRRKVSVFKYSCAVLGQRRWLLCCLDTGSIIFVHYYTLLLAAPLLQHPYLYLIYFTPCHLCPLPPIFTSLSLVFNSSSYVSSFPESATSQEETGSRREEVM